MEKNQFLDFMGNWMALNHSSLPCLSVLPQATKKKIMEAGPLPSNVDPKRIKEEADKKLEIKNRYSYQSIDDSYYYCFVKVDTNYRVFVLDNERNVLYSLDGNCDIQFVDTNNNTVPVDATIEKAFFMTIH